MTIKRFIYNNLDYIHSAFDIRRKVFVEEQKVKDYEEFDDFEKSSIHYLSFDGGLPVGTARWRITDSGIKLERFAVLKEERRNGVGSSLLQAMLAELPNEAPVYLHAQLTAVAFYGKHGFQATGPEFSECGIRHFKMIRNGRRAPFTLDQAIACVFDFHRAFKLNHEAAPAGRIAPELVALRHRLMHEENEEYKAAAESGDLVEISDALGDMLYILCGTIISHGLQGKIAEIFEEIQRSNMSKLDADGRPIYREDGKVMKSDLYFKPDLARILRQYL